MSSKTQQWSVKINGVPLQVEGVYHHGSYSYDEPPDEGIEIYSIRADDNGADLWLLLEGTEIEQAIYDQIASQMTDLYNEPPEAA